MVVRLLRAQFLFIFFNLFSSRLAWRGDDELIFRRKSEWITRI